MTTEEVQPGVRRRSVLKWIGLGAGATVVAASTGIGVRAAANGGFTAGTGAPYDLWREWPTLSGVERVVAAGVLACNPHNTQPWVMVPGDGSIDLFSDPTRRMPVNDAADREHFAGLGCAVENMVVAAGATGFDTTVTVFPEGTASDHVARIGLRPAPPRPDPLADAIPRRHTNRGPYTPAPVDTAALAAARVEGTGVRWVTERGARDRLGALYVEATEAIVADTAQSEEAFSWFRNERA